ncbi:MAG: hypothetical protein V4722_00020 [Bacteroidota bacterium]
MKLKSSVAMFFTDMPRSGYPSSVVPYVKEHADSICDFIFYKQVAHLEHIKRSDNFKGTRSFNSAF